MRQHGEIPGRRRRCGRPFERTAVPGIAGDVTALIARADADDELHDRQHDAGENHQRADESDQHQRLPAGLGIMLHPPRRAHQAQRVKRHEGEIEADEPAPERRLAEPFVQRETEGLREPEIVAREDAEQHPADDDVVKVRHQEQAVVEHEVGGRRRQQHSRHAADDESDHEAERPIDRHAESDPAAIHREQPVEHLHAGRHRDDHAHDAEKAVDVGARAHREEMVQPDHEREHADRHRRDHHRAIAEQRLARKRRDDLGENSKRGQDQDVNLGVAPSPDEVDVHHLRCRRRSSVKKWKPR